MRSLGKYGKILESTIIPVVIKENLKTDDEDDDEVEAGPSPQNDLFFFTNLRKINPGMKSSKFDRGVGSNGGRWHGDDVHSFHSKGITWNRRRYCYKNPNIGTPDASWIMLEYSLDDSLMQNVPHYTVLCRIRKKSNRYCSRKRKSSQSSSQPEPKRQSKKLNSKLRTPPIEETVHVTAHRPHVHVPVPWCEYL
uniref:NAC domain-containing protein n=1 Tax=Populus alba TaxID=43335 RepID=A0A4U5P5S4_POPAL|nr:hypothetical protein D5086_0000226980 [Populus alba]